MSGSPEAEGRREALLRAANELVAEEGFAAATLRNVAARAGCTTGSVTHHFAGRQELLVAMLRAAHEAAGRRMLEQAQQEEEPRARLRAVLLEALPLDATRLAEWRVWVAFWSEAASNAAIAGENLHRYQEWRLLLSSLLLPFFRSTEPREQAVETLVALVDGLGLGLTVSAAPRRRPGALAAAVAVLDRQLDALCGGVDRRPGGGGGGGARGSGEAGPRGGLRRGGGLRSVRV
jgi:AcrR family transcriptional regulator